MYKYFVTASIGLKDGSNFYTNFYYEIDYKLNTIQGIENVINDIKNQCNAEKVIILFFTELEED